MAMANTYTQLYIHAVFAPKYQSGALTTPFDARLHRYIIAILQNRGHDFLAINSLTDHMHLFFGLNPKESVASIMAEVKAESSRWINREQLVPGKFYWQEGYGAFSHSKSQVDGVVKYIINQQEHHRHITFLDEYRKMLQDFGVDYEDQYLFKAPLQQWKGG